MQIYSIKSINFSANIDNKFKEAAKRHYRSQANSYFYDEYKNQAINPKEKNKLISNKINQYVQFNMNQFDKCAKKYIPMGNADTEIKYKFHWLDTEDGIKKHALIIHDKGQKDVVLASNRSFKHLLQTFYDVAKKYPSEDSITRIAKEKRK